METQKDAELLVLLLRWSREMGADQQGHQLPLKYWGVRPARYRLVATPLVPQPSRSSLRAVAGMAGTGR